MSFVSKASLHSAAVAAVLMLSGVAVAADDAAGANPSAILPGSNATQFDNNSVLSLDIASTPPDPSLSNPANSPTLGETKKTPVAPATQEIVAQATESPNIHGFFNSSFKSAYVTPRGLVVQNKGLVWQPIIGLVLPLGDAGPFKKIAAVGGVWNDVDTAEAGAGNPTTGGWDEMDPFFGFSANVTDEISLALGYTVFDSPQHGYVAEHNVDLKISYDDTKLWGTSGFALHPYVDLWWAISGGSTVVLGQSGATGYAEPGIVPTYTIKAISQYPITLTMPVYVSVGPRSYWASGGLPGGNFGLVSGALNGTVPLSFIPTKYGFWHADASFTYDYLINTSLLHAGTILSGNTDRNVFIASVGFGFNF